MVALDVVGKLVNRRGYINHTRPEVDRGISAQSRSIGPVLTRSKGVEANGGAWQPSRGDHAGEKAGCLGYALADRGIGCFELQFQFSSVLRGHDNQPLDGFGVVRGETPILRENLVRCPRAIWGDCLREGGDCDFCRAPGGELDFGHFCPALDRETQNLDMRVRWCGRCRHSRQVSHDGDRHCCEAVE